MRFTFAATIDSSFLTVFNDPLVPHGATLFGEFSYDQSLSTQIGDSHYFDPGEADLRLYTEQGFELELRNAVTNVAPTEEGDFFTVQSFVSEFPNDWHILIDLQATGWLNGSNDLPNSFPDSFDYGYVSAYFTDEFEWVRIIDATLVSIDPAPDQPSVIAETHTVSINHKVATLSLDHEFMAPVVIAFVATENGKQPVNVRVTEVDGTEISLRLQEPSYLDGWHMFETVNVLVVEAGSWMLSDGTLLEAGSLESSQLTSDGFEDVAFQTDFDQAPVILSHVQSANGGDFVTTRQRDTDSDGFRIAMQEEEARNAGGHVTETIGWVAFEAGSGTSGDMDWFAGQVSEMSHLNASVALADAFSEEAHVLASLSSYAGRDTAWMRGDGGASQSVSLSIEEERSLDRETRHIPETADVFVFSEAGTLTGTEYDLGL